MSLVALANVVCDDVFVAPVPRRSAGAGHRAAAAGARAARSHRLRAAARRGRDGAARRCRVLASRRFRSPHTASPHTHFLSNGRYTAAVTHAGGGFSAWRGLAVTRQREDRTSDAGAHFIYLRDPWSGEVWSPTYLPDGPRARRVRRHIRAGQGDVPSARRRLRNAAADRGLAGRRRRSPPPVDHQPRQSAARDRGHELRRNRAGTARRRPRASGVRQAVRRDRARRAERRAAVQPPPAQRGRGASCGPSTCSASTDGSAERWSGRPIARSSSAAAGRPPIRSRSTGARCRARPAPCWIRWRRSAIACASCPGAFVRVTFATGVAPDRDTALALVSKYRDGSAASRAFSMAFTHAQVTLQHLGLTDDHAMLVDAYRVARLRIRRHRAPARRLWRDNTLRPVEPVGLSGSPATCRSCWCA